MKSSPVFLVTLAAALAAGCSAPPPPEQVRQAMERADQLRHAVVGATRLDELAAWLSGDSPADQLEALRKHLAAALEALDQGNIAAAKQAYREFEQGWEQIEGGIRPKSRAIYDKVEGAMSGVGRSLLSSDQPDVPTAQAALKHLDETVTAALPALREP